MQIWHLSGTFSALEQFPLDSASNLLYKMTKKHLLLEAGLAEGWKDIFLEQVLDDSPYYIDYFFLSSLSELHYNVA